MAAQVQTVNRLVEYRAVAPEAATAGQGAAEAAAAIQNTVLFHRHSPAVAADFGA
jgi:hypothetical protein